MSSLKRLTADLLLGIQITGGLLITGSQIIRLFSSTQGLSIAMFGLAAIFFGINLVLAVRAHKILPSRVTRQTIFVYVLWTVLCTTLVATALVNNPSIWDRNETTISVIAAFGAIIVMIVAYLKKLSFGNPMVKSWLAIAFKAVPQVAQAYKLFLMGGAGLAGGAIIGGHMTMLTRLGQLTFSIKEAGWDKNRWALFLSEAANWLTWVLVTIVWFIV